MRRNDRPHSPRRQRHPNRPRHPARPHALRIAVALATSAVLVGVAIEPAHADDYPTWQDVQNAKANESAAQAQVTRIEGLISGLTSQVQQTQAAADEAAGVYARAQQKFDDADAASQELQRSATELTAKADAATTQAGRLAAELYRTGGDHLTASIFLEGTSSAKDAEELLGHLGAASKLVENTTTIYRQARQARDTAKAKSDQASAARSVRERLQADAESAMRRAVAAALQAQQALGVQQAQEEILQGQLAALKDTTTVTVAGYQKGVEERARAAAAAAAAAKAAAAAAARASAATPNSHGWVKPVYGRITSTFGRRTAPCSGCSSFHQGADIGAAQGATIYAARDGVVGYAGRNGAYGNYVRIDHGGGIATAYGHIVNGGILVRIGQHVSAGEPIARVGSTGASTGPHLHFEVRINGSAVDPIAYMRQRGAPLG